MIVYIHAMPTKAIRHRRILELLEDLVFESQAELGQRLAAEGVEVTQATLSRDLADLGVVKGPDGYRLPDGGGAAGPAESRVAEAMRRQVTNVDVAEAMVVLRTRPGYAHAVAVELDALRDPTVVGTLAGDDTIAVLVRTRDDLPAARERLASLAGWSDAAARAV